VTSYASMAEALAALDQEIEAKAHLAFEVGCRLAITPPYPISAGHWMHGCMPGKVHWSPMEPIELTYDFVMLSPGELPPLGRPWTIYEEREGLLVGRTFHG
jgi:hypothetical protein